jgi:hypothetical protein
VTVPDDIEPLLRRIEELLDLAVRRAARVAAGCRHWLRLLGGLGAALDRLAGEVERAADDVRAHLRTMLTHPGDPAALWRAGERWRHAIAGPAAAHAAAFTAGARGADDHWRGPAAEAYTRILPSQRAALQHLHDTATATAASLQETAAALAAYWTAVAATLAALTTQLATAAAAMSTPGTAPAGAALALAATSQCRTALELLDRALAAELGHARRVQTALEAGLTSGPAFPAGHWPRAAAESLTDASLTDGDGLDWSLRR